MGKKDDKRRELFREDLCEALEDPQMLKWLRKLLELDPSGELEKAEEEIKRLKAELADAVKASATMQQQLKDQRAEQTRERQQQDGQITRLQQERDALDKKLLELKNKSPLPPEQAEIVRHARGDAELMSRFKLDEQLDDAAFLLRLATALAPEAQFKRLWEMYKERCNKSNGPLSAGDRRLLNMALEWVNAQCPDRPYGFDEPAEGSKFDFDKQQKPSTPTQGDSIAALWLPGVQGLKLKPLVATR